MIVNFMDAQARPLMLNICLVVWFATPHITTIFLPALLTLLILNTTANHTVTLTI